MKKLFRAIRNRVDSYITNEKIPYEIKSFYLVTTCAMPIFLLLAATFYARRSDSMLSIYCLVLFVYSLLLSTAGAESGKEIRFSVIFALTLNFLITPIMFLLSEGVYFGMVLIFALGIILTAVLLGTYKYIYKLVAAEFIFDAGLIFYTYFRKDKVYMGRSNMSSEAGISLSFFIVALTIIFLFLYQDYINTEMRNKVEKDNESIKKAENMRTRFLANMTHEIRTPMNAIIGMTNLMLKEELTTSARENANIIKNESELLLHIINNILEYSKLDSGRAELINNVFSFRKLISGIIDETLSIYIPDDIKLYVFISDDIPDKLFGDEVRIRQVFRYLLFSQLSRTPGSSVNLDINYKFDESTSVAYFNIRIASTGGGLNESEIAAIYNAYSNYDSRQKTDYNRTGLEISICKKILNMMNGDLKIESIEGIGNAFEFSFTNYVVDKTPIVVYSKDEYVRPLVYVQDKNSELIWQRIIEELGISASYVKTQLSFKRAMETQSYTAIYIPDSAYADLKEYIDIFNCHDMVYVITDHLHSIEDFNGCRILRYPFYLFNFIESIDGSYDRQKYSQIVEKVSVTYPYVRVLCVDDNNVNLVVLDNLLREYDIKATLCSSGERALEVLAVDEYDIIFIDQKMPNMDGIELASRIKELSNANSSVPLICATADFGPALKEKLIMKGFNDYISKPVIARYLENILEKYIPEELRMVTVSERPLSRTGEIKSGELSVSPDTAYFDPNIGINNLSGNKEAFADVIRVFYEEGLTKAKEVPEYLKSGDIALYTTNVHALKSSCATVGLMSLSAQFMQLETAGNVDNRVFLEENSSKVFERFENALETVKDYLEQL